MLPCSRIISIELISAEGKQHQRMQFYEADRSKPQAKLRAMVEGYTFPQVCRVTISVGYTRINPKDVATLCLERADAALYYAKSHGRNNVRGCEALVAAGEIKRKVGDGEIELF